MGRPPPATAPPSGLLALRAVPGERQHLLDAARPVRVADRRRQQARRELDALGVRVRRPLRRVVRALLRGASSLPASSNACHGGHPGTAAAGRPAPQGTEDPVEVDVERGRRAPSSSRRDMTTTIRYTNRPSGIQQVLCISTGHRAKRKECGRWGVRQQQTRPSTMARRWRPTARPRPAPLRRRPRDRRHPACAPRVEDGRLDIDELKKRSEGLRRQDVGELAPLTADLGAAPAAPAVALAELARALGVLGRDVGAPRRDLGDRLASPPATCRSSDRSSRSASGRWAGWPRNDQRRRRHAIGTFRGSHVTFDLPRCSMTGTAGDWRIASPEAKLIARTRRMRSSRASRRRGSAWSRARRCALRAGERLDRRAGRRRTAAPAAPRGVRRRPHRSHPGGAGARRGAGRRGRGTALASARPPTCGACSATVAASSTWAAAGARGRALPRCACTAWTSTRAT